MILEIATVLAILTLIKNRVKKIERILPKELQTDIAKISITSILKLCDFRKISKPQIAYILATAWHESQMGNSMIEFASGLKYEFRKDLGNTQKGDGPKYKGRGFVQLTGRSNYTYWGERLGIDLVNNPELAAIPKYAVYILVDGMLEGKFTSKKLSKYINSNLTDYRNARRVINGLDQDRKIAEYAEKIEKVL